MQCASFRTTHCVGNYETKNYQRIVYFSSISFLSFSLFLFFFHFSFLFSLFFLSFFIPFFLLSFFLSFLLSFSFFLSIFPFFLSFWVEVDYSKTSPLYVLFLFCEFCFYSHPHEMSSLMHIGITSLIDNFNIVKSPSQVTKQISKPLTGMNIKLRNIHQSISPHSLISKTYTVTYTTIQKISW